MAHMIDGKGTYPDKAGEFCGNYCPDNPYHFTIPILATMRFGRPHPCEDPLVTAEHGWVGLYLKEDQPLFDWETPCETPPELLEPPIN